MESESWLSCEKTAVLQGAFLLAEKLCGAGKLSELGKEEWERVGRPIREAVVSICGVGRGGPEDRLPWRKRMVCVLWRKLLEAEEGKGVDSAWRENPFFAVQNALPQISRALLYELIKSTGLFREYANLLMCFPPAGLCSELASLAEHLVTEATEEDARLLLEVWWEMWKADGRIDGALHEEFASQCSRHATPCLDFPNEASEDALTQAPTSSCVQSILFGAIVEMKGCIVSPDICLFALSVCLDTLYTSFLLDQALTVTPAMYLQSLSRAVCLKERQAGVEGCDLGGIIEEEQRELAATHRLPQFKSRGFTQMDAVRTLLIVCQDWGQRELLKMGDPDTGSLRLMGILHRVIEALEERVTAEAIADTEKQGVDDLIRTLRNLAGPLLVPDLQSNSADMVRVAVTILDRRLNRYQHIASLFASEVSWALNNGNEWISCLQRNKDAFLHKDLLLKLASFLVAKCQSDTDMAQSKALKDIVLDVFSELPLQDKNEALAAVIGSWGVHGLNGVLPQGVCEGFGEELNLSFNSLIQNRSQCAFGPAVSAVARVAVQDPAAVLSRCCHMAVMNQGADALLSRVLQQLPGLNYPQCPGAVGQGLARGELLSCCLQEAVWGKLGTTQEEGQFLSFLAALMCSNPGTEVPEERSGLLPPEIVVRTFVLPCLSASLPGCYSLELCLRVLLCTLNQEDRIKTPHWLMSCSPFPLLAALCRLLNDSYACWEEPAEGGCYVSIESKQLLIGALQVIEGVVGREIAAAPEVWSRAMFWLHSKLEGLDWSVYFHLKSIFGGHFKKEGPSSLFAVCELSEREWAGLDLPQYGQGTGLLAWVECCCIPGLSDAMLSSLVLDHTCPDQVTMFGKGLLVAVVQTLPWRTAEEWRTLLGTLKQLLESGRLYVPYSLEYVDFLPLLDLQAFGCELRLSAMLLRVMQLLCGVSCQGWLPERGWAHLGQLYASAVRDVLASAGRKLTPVQPPAPPSSPGPEQEGLLIDFVLSQLFCHVLHVLVMLPHGREPLFLCALEILTQYQALMASCPSGSSGPNRRDTRHFLTTLTDNLESVEMKAALHQKIAQL
ncbi:hypothetical protein GJAV_G00058920 [Gymnothorax javanicus]|nr:hypothetical protein GJAV_G00058920 [Gymnothorax javanicus]